MESTSNQKLVANSNINRLIKCEQAYKQEWNRQRFQTLPAFELINLTLLRKNNLYNYISEKCLIAVTIPLLRPT